MFKTIKKFTSCFLVLCMLLSMVPMGVFATETINYVSLGDSMANGYGLAGYQPAQGNVNGYRQEAPDAYPSQVATAKGWDLTQLAISAMRAEDLNFILNFDWEDDEQVALAAESQSWNKDDFIANKSRWNETFNCGDLYTWDEFVDGRFNDYAAIVPAESGTEAYAEMFQDAVAGADYVSMGIGNANFGVFMLGRITNAFGILNGTPEGDAWIEFQDALSKLDEPAQAVVMEVYNKLTSYLAQQNYIAVEQAELLVNAVAYTVASYVLNYAEVIDRIVELNPDVNIILVGLMNTMSGSKMDFWGNEIDLGDILDIVINTMNTYIAALPSVSKLTGNYAEATFYYAEEPHVEMVVNTLDDAWAASWTGNGYDVIRERLVEDICDGMVFDMVAPLFSSQGVTLDRALTVADIKNYELNGPTAFYPDTDKIASCQVYLAFEEAIVDSTQIEVMDAEAVFSLADPTKLSTVFAAIGAQIDPSDLQATLTTALTNNTTMKGLLNLFARHIIGNGIGSHPSAVGHDTLTAAILDALENEYTTDDKVIDTATALVEFIAKYGKDAVEEVYAYAESKGYIELLKDKVIELQDAAYAKLVAAEPELRAKYAELIAKTDELLVNLETETGKELPTANEIIDAIIDYENTFTQIKGYIENDAEIQELIAEAEAIIAQINDIIANPEVYIQNVIDDVIAKYEENLEAATTADYVACGENHYVAFAGTNTSGAHDYEYSYKFGDYIDVTDASTHYFTDGTPIADAVDYIESLNATAKADLESATIVTYQTDAKNIVLPLVDGVDVTADDWASLLDVDAEKAAEIKATIIAALKGEYADEGAAALNDGVNTALEIKEEAMSKLPADWATALAAEGAKADEVIETILETAYDIVSYSLDATLVDMVAPLAEELVFNTVAYLVNNINAVEAIKATNPNALIAIVGLHNPVKGLMVSVDGQVVDLGEYVDYFIEATNVYNTIYAAASENVIFVEADETEIAGYEGTINIDTTNPSSLMQAIMTLDNKLIAGTVVTENGHNYIVNQLKTAITKVNHNDSDNDDICDNCGENLAPVTPTPTPNRPGPGGGSAVSQFTIKFETNGGSKIDSVKVERKGILAEPVAPTKEGFDFAGWYTDKELTQKYDFSQEVTKSFTLYAKWFKNPFIDVKKGDWFYEAVMFVFENGITKGVSETEYAPQGKVTRAQFITMLCRAYEIEEMTGDNFADCGDTWYTGYLAAAKQLGISNGVGDNMFAPEKEITREEMVTLVYNYLKSIDKVAEETAELSFTDSNNVSEWAKTAVAYAAKNGIVNGKDNNIFDPQGTATRAELAQIFYNMFK